MTSELVGPPEAGVTEFEIDGRITVYSPSTLQVLVLNDTASDVWRLADGTMDLEAIVIALSQAYGCAPTSLRGDVVATLERFHCARVLRA